MLEWYKNNSRNLPWRENNDPYRIWVSEIMLQQTRVDTVISFFLRWMERFAKVKDLASATETEVLSAWEGLGYYSRARNLHKASKLVMDQFNGIFPSTVDELILLPGIGFSTAGAIASIAFHKDEAVMDGNVKRIYARLFDFQHPINNSLGEKKLWEIARQIIPNGSAGLMNQALMDLGAMVCLPKKPICSECPISNICFAHSQKLTNERPISKMKPKPPEYDFICAVIIYRNKVLLEKKPSKGLLGGLWEFPNMKIANCTDQEKVLSTYIYEQYRMPVEVNEKMGIIRHAYTHFKSRVQVYRCQVNEDATGIQRLTWIDIENLGNYPMGKIARSITRMI